MSSVGAPRPGRGVWILAAAMRSLATLALGLPLLALALACGEAVDAPQEAGGAGKTGGETNFYSQLGEEILIREFFDDRRGGVYLDVGAAWARRNSTTFYLEKHLGWTGIGVDALDVYRESWERFRPQSRFFQYAVSNRSGDTVSFFQAAEPTISSLFREKLEEWWGRDLENYEVRVETITLTDLLDRNGIARIDFLSIDIEGAEPLALEGFEIERFAPELVCIEVSSEESGRFILDYFASHGYERIDAYLPRDEANWYFRRRG